MVWQHSLQSKRKRNILIETLKKKIELCIMTMVAKVSKENDIPDFCGSEIHEAEIWVYILFSLTFQWQI